MAQGYVSSMREIQRIAAIEGMDAPLKGSLVMTCRRRDWTVIDGLITAASRHLMYAKWHSTSHLTLTGQKAVVNVEFRGSAEQVMRLQEMLLPYHVGQ